MRTEETLIELVKVVYKLTGAILELATEVNKLTQETIKLNGRIEDATTHTRGGK